MKYWILYRIQLLIFFLALIPGYAVAQQTSLYTQYYLNPYLYNPALAGYKGVTGAHLLYRKQWVGVDGAPETQVFTIDGELETQPVGLGLTFYNDVTNIIGRTGGALTGAYEVQLATDHSLRFGLSFTAIHNRIFFDRIRAEDISDPNLLTAVDQRTAFEGNAGLAYRFKELQIGFSAEQLFQNTFRYQNEAVFKSLNYSLVRHYYTMINYGFEVGGGVTLTPQVLVRTVQGLPSQFDLNLLADYKEIAWINLNYRHDIGAGMAFGFAISEQLIFGYSYEFPTTDLNILGSATHEFMLGVRLQKPTDSPLAREKAVGVKTLERQSAAQNERIDALQQRNEQAVKQLEETRQVLRAQNEELRLLKEIVSGYQQELDSAISELRVDESSGRQGKYYLVVGALKSIGNAKRFQRMLKREAGLDTRLVQSVSGTWYFLYTQDLDAPDQAISLIEALQKSPAADYIIGTPWIYEREKDDSAQE